MNCLTILTSNFLTFCSFLEVPWCWLNCNDFFRVVIFPQDHPNSFPALFSPSSICLFTFARLGEFLRPGCTVWRHKFSQHSSRLHCFEYYLEKAFLLHLSSCHFIGTIVEISVDAICCCSPSHPQRLAVLHWGMHVPNTVFRASRCLMGSYSQS